MRTRRSAKQPQVTLWDVPVESGDGALRSVSCSVGGGAHGRPPAKVTRSFGLGWARVAHGCARPFNEGTYVYCILFRLKVEADRRALLHGRAPALFMNAGGAFTPGHCNLSHI